MFYLRLEAQLKKLCLPDNGGAYRIAVEIYIYYRGTQFCFDSAAKLPATAGWLCMNTGFVFMKKMRHERF